MSILKEKGYLETVLPVNSFAKSKKQTFVIKLIGASETFLAFDLWNDNISQLNTFSKGDFIEVEGYAKSTLYNDKWFTNLGALKISLITSVKDLPSADKTSSNEVENIPEGADDLPF